MPTSPWKLVAILILGSILAAAIVNVATPRGPIIDNRPDRSGLHDYLDQRVR